MQKLLIALCTFTVFLANSVGANPVLNFIETDEYYATRSELQLQQFPDALSGDQLQLCLNFLMEKQVGENYRSKIVRQNDLADWLLCHESYTVITTGIILGVLNDESQDILWRDYVLQKMGMAYLQSGQSVENQEAIVRELFRFAGDSQTTFSGTALLGLLRIFEAQNEENNPNVITADKLIGSAMWVLEDSSFSHFNKATALQVAAHVDASQVLDAARSYMMDETLDLQLRASAIAVMSNDMTTNDQQYLAKLKSHPDYRIRRSVRSTLKSID